MLSSALAGLDLSPVSEAMVEWLPRLSPVVRRLVLAHVIPLERVEHVAPGYPVDRLEDALAREAVEKLRGYAGRLRGYFDSVEVLEPPPVGVPGVVLAREAARLGLELIVVASHGKGVLRRVLLGSTSEEVLNTADRSVLVARVARRREGPVIEGDPLEGPILAAVAMDRSAEDVAECAGEAAGPRSARVILLHVLEPGETRLAAEKTLEGLAARVRAAGAGRVEVVVAQGRPVKEISRVAREEGVSLALAGPSASGEGLGSVAEYMVRRLPTHVAICRRPPA